MVYATSVRAFAPLPPPLRLVMQGWAAGHLSSVASYCYGTYTLSMRTAKASSGPGTKAFTCFGMFSEVSVALGPPIAEMETADRCQSFNQPVMSPLCVACEAGVGPQRNQRLRPQRRPREARPWVREGIGRSMCPTLFPLPQPHLSVAAYLCVLMLHGMAWRGVGWALFL
jgi:hypothetical protein